MTLVSYARMLTPNTIRVVSICVFRNNGRILAYEGFDSVKNERFYRPLGGTVHFGERAADAVAREIREELQGEITDIRQLGVLENLFTCDGQEGHEVIFVFDATFVDRSLYSRDVIYGSEPERAARGKDPGLRAVWLGAGAQRHNSCPVYPVGLLELLAEAT